MPSVDAVSGAQLVPWICQNLRCLESQGFKALMSDLRCQAFDTWISGTSCQGLNLHVRLYLNQVAHPDLSVS